jgi:outer membrane protein assembly factor BamB
VRAAVRGAAAFALALLLGGCSYFGWFQDSGKKPMPLTEFSATASPKVAWSASVGKAEDFHFLPMVDGNRIFTAAADGTVTILDAGDGRVVTRFDAGRKLSAGAGGGGDQILVASGKGEVVAFDTAGKQQWVSQVNGDVLSPPVLAGKRVLVRTGDGRIFALNAADGKRQWVYQRPMPALLLRSFAGLLFVPPGNLVAGYPGGKLIALDLEDGKLVWEVTVSLPAGATELERIADVTGVPVIDGGRICAAAFQGKVACFDIQGGNTLWTRDASSPSGVAMDDKNLYFSDAQDNVQALDKEGGASRWKQDKLQRRRLTAPVVVEGKVVVGDFEGYLHVLSRDDGAFIGRVRVDGGAVTALVPFKAGVLAQTAGGTLSYVGF